MNGLVPSWAAGYGRYDQPLDNPPVYSQEYVAWREGELPYDYFPNLLVEKPGVDPLPSVVTGAIAEVPQEPYGGDYLPHEGTEDWGPANRRTCMRTQCGFISQEEAGWDLLLACSLLGYPGVRPGCVDQTCVPYAEGDECAGVVPEPVEEYVSPPGPAPLPFPVPERAGPPIQLQKPMPSITGSTLVRYPGVGPETGPLECGFGGWVDSHKVLAAGLVAGAFLLLRR